MAQNATRFIPKLEALKICVVVLAIVVGGFWVYWNFFATEASLFHERALTESSFSWIPVESAEQCRAQFRVTFTNTGNKSFKVERVRLRGWRFDWELDSGKSHNYLDVFGLQAKPTFLDETFKSDNGGPFLLEYAPQEKVTHNFDILIERTGPLWIMVKVELSQSKKDDARFSWYELRAEPMCNSERRG